MKTKLIVLLYIFRIIHPQKQKRSVQPFCFWGEHSKGLSNQADVELDMINAISATDIAFIMSSSQAIVNWLNAPDQSDFSEWVWCIITAFITSTNLPNGSYENKDCPGCLQGTCIDWTGPHACSFFLKKIYDLNVWRQCSMCEDIVNTFQQRKHQHSSLKNTAGFSLLGSSKVYTSLCLLSTCAISVRFESSYSWSNQIKAMFA